MVTPGRVREEAATGAVETLSQLVARILKQLAVSAWLPSAALTLLVSFVVQLGRVLDRAKQPPPAAAVGTALGELGGIGATGLILLLVAVVVLTMVTQAFTFESIRLLEGYWGVNPISERLAEARCTRFRRRAKRLRKRHRSLTRAAWKAARRQLRNDPNWTPTMLDALQAQVLRKPGTFDLTDEQVERVDRKQWLTFGPAELLRRRTNIETKLRDYPVPKHTMPTWLGNVLRRFEDDTGYPSVESLVDDVYHLLPEPLQVSHDEQRSRLDLYCSMTFVMAFVAVVAVVRFAWHHPGYAAAAVLLCAAAGVVLYRAAIASARYYGPLLFSIARYAPAAGGEVA